MSGSVRLEALLSLEAAITCAIPQLRGRVCPFPTPPNHELKFPSLAIVPVGFEYLPDQATEVHECEPTKVVMNVGRHEALIQLRLVHSDPIRRTKLEEKITDLFIAQAMRPGILLTTVNAVPWAGPFVCAWELDDESWQDERAFDSEFWSVIVVTGQIPALAVRGDATRIRDLRMDVGASEAALPANAETSLRVGADGSVTPVP